jgi:two-component system, OmpR family, sensor kinase
MAFTTPRRGFWQSLRQLPGRTPLRIKLISAVLAFVAAALAVISVAGIAFLHSYLIGQANSSLSSFINSEGPNPAYSVLHVLNGGPPQAESQTFVDWLSSSGKLYSVVQPVAVNGFHSTPMAGPSVSSHSTWIAASRPVTLAAMAGPGRWQVVAYPYSFATATGTPVRGTIIVGLDVTGAYRTLGKLTGIDVIVSGVILLALFVAGVALVRASLRPLIDIEQTAGAIAAGDLTRRVPERDPRTEVGRLGRSLNAMLSQIEAAFHARSQSEEAARRSEERMRQFVADASHELRTPLTAIRGFAEYYRQRGGLESSPDATGAASPGPANAGYLPARNGAGQLAPTDLDRIMRRVEQESARMGVLVEDMLLLARLDQQRPLDRSTVDLLTLAADAVHDARVVAPNRNINLTVGAGAALLVIGDEVRLRQVIGNLMSNALSHTPEGTPIEVLIRSGSVAEVKAATATAATQKTPDEAADAGDALVNPEPGAWPGARPGSEPGTDDAAQAAAVLEVTDYGPGLTKEQSRHAFERFYRADRARTSGGTGLGLAIVAALISAHGGAVWVQSKPGSGATFSIALPLAPEAVQGAGLDEDATDPEIGNPGHEDPAHADPGHATEDPSSVWIESGPPGDSTG